MHDLSSTGLGSYKLVVRAQFPPALALDKNRSPISRAGLPGLDLSFPFCPFLGLSRFIVDFPVLFLFLVLFILVKAPRRNSHDRVRDTTRTLPEKKWGNPGLDLPSPKSMSTHP